MKNTFLESRKRSLNKESYINFIREIYSLNSNMYQPSLSSPSIDFLMVFQQLFNGWLLFFISLRDNFFWSKSTLYEKCQYRWLFKKNIYKLLKTKQIMINNLLNNLQKKTVRKLIDGLQRLGSWTQIITNYFFATSLN